MVLLAPQFAAEVDLLFVVAKALEAEALAHTVGADHPAGEVGGHLDILRSAGGEVAGEALFGDAPGGGHHEDILHLRFGAVENVALREGHRRPQGPPARDNGHLVERLGVLQEHLGERVTALVPGGNTAVAVGHRVRPAFAAPEDLIARLLQVGVGDGRAVAASGKERGFIKQVRQVRSREAGRTAGHALEVHILAQLDLAGVHLEDCQAALHGGQVHDNLAVEAAGASEGGVEHIHAVGGGHHDNPGVALEAIHLHEHRVEGLLTLVVAAADAGKAGAADGVNLVNKENAGGVLLGLGEHIAHATGPHAHEHLHEVRAADAEEGHLRLAGNRLGQQRLARAGRPHQQHALRHLAAQVLEALGVLEELDDLGHLLLRLVHAGHVLETGLGLLLIHQACARLPEGEGPALAPSAHLPQHKEVEEQEEQRQRQNRDDQRAEPVVPRLLRGAHAQFAQLLLQPLHAQDVHAHLALLGRHARLRLALGRRQLDRLVQRALDVRIAPVLADELGLREHLVADHLSLRVHRPPGFHQLPEVELRERLRFAPKDRRKRVLSRLAVAPRFPAAEDAHQRHHKDRQQHPHNEGALPIGLTGLLRRGDRLVAARLFGPGGGRGSFCHKSFP